MCNSDIRSAIVMGVVPKISESSFVPQKLVRGELVEGVCKDCDARARTRCLAAMLARSEAFIQSGAPVLLASADQHQLALYKQHFTNLTHISREGDYDDPNCILGVDLNDLSRFKADSFLYAFLIGVIDYIPTPWKAFSELMRVLKPGGTAIIYIMPYRVTSLSEGVKVINTNALAHEAYARKQGKETGIPDCQFDKDALMGWLKEAGFNPSIVLVKDHLSPLELKYFVAKKPFRPQAPHLASQSASS